MPERLDRVIVATSRREVVIPWSSRDELLARLERLPSAAGIVAAFEAVGASRPVKLTDEQEAELRDEVERWFKEVGANKLPAGIFDLRKALEKAP